MDEQILWKTFLDGSRTSFEEIFKRTYKSLYQYGSRISRDQEIVDDCIQDLFFELWTSRERLGDVGTVRGYLFRSLRYKLLRAERKNSMHAILDENTFSFSEDSHESQLIAMEHSDAQKKQLSHYIEQLSPRQKEAISLRFHHQMEYEEISRVMAISYPAAVNLIYKSIKYLRENMAGIPGSLLCFTWLNLLC